MADNVAGFGSADGGFGSERGCGDRCGRHLLVEVATIGRWLHGQPGSYLAVCDLVVCGEIWQPHHHDPLYGHHRLTAEIVAAGRQITCEHAMDARRLADGRTELINGVHRYAIAVELGIGTVPVKMEVAPGGDAWAWL